MATLQTRLTNFLVDRDRECIYAGDDKGLMYAFDLDLMLRRTASCTTHGVGIHALTQDDQRVFSRDVAGNVVCWDKDAWAPLNFMVSQHLVGDEIEEGSEAVPSPSNLLLCLGNELMVANPYGTVSVLDKDSFAFLRAMRVATRAFPECMIATPDGGLIASDVRGTIYTSAGPTHPFQATDSVPGGVVHSIAYDGRHDRFWGTSDVTGGVFFLDRNGKFSGAHRFSNDDIEEVVLNSDCTKAYVGCFDHFVHVFQNDVTPVEIGCIGRFKFQVNHVALIDDARLIVLLESGEIHVIDVESGHVLAQNGGSDALWNFTVDGETLYCASERGAIEKYRVDSKGTAISFTRCSEMDDLGRGRIRDLVLLPDKTMVCAATSGSVMKVCQAGTVLWEIQTGGIVRNVAASPDYTQGAACNEIGEIFTFDMETGHVLRRMKNAKPVWCIAYDVDGGLVCGERMLSVCDERLELARLLFLDSATLACRHTVTQLGNYKRIRRMPDGKLLINGNGSVGIQVYDPKLREVVRYFNDWVINTPENAVIHGDRLYVITYGYQLITYAIESTQAVDVQYVTEGYPGGLEVFVNRDGIPFLIASGRNFLMAFRIDGEAPELVTTRYLYDTGSSRSPPLEGTSLSEKSVRMREPQALFYKTTLTSLEATAA